MSDDQILDFTRRLQTLETECRNHRFRQRGLAGITFAMLLVGVLGGAMLQNITRFPGVVEVIDGNQTPRLVLSGDAVQGRPGIFMHAPDGKVRLVLGTNPNHDAHLEFHDAKGAKRIEMGIGPQGDAYFQMFRGDGFRQHSFTTAP